MVTTNCEADALGFRFVRADCAFLFTVGHFAVLGYFVVWDEEDGVRCCHSSKTSLGKSVEVGIHSLPDFLVRARASARYSSAALVTLFMTACVWCVLMAHFGAACAV